MNNILDLILLIFGLPLLLYYLSGWNNLADCYKTNRGTPEIVLKNQSAKLHKLTCTKILDIGICEEGLYLSVNFYSLNKIVSLLISWNSIDEIKYYIDRTYGKSYEIHLIDVKITITLMKETIETLEERFGRTIITDRSV